MPSEGQQAFKTWTCGPLILVWSRGRSRWYAPDRPSWIGMAYLGCSALPIWVNLSRHSTFVSIALASPTIKVLGFDHVAHARRPYILFLNLKPNSNCNYLIRFWLFCQYIMPMMNPFSVLKQYIWNSSQTPIKDINEDVFDPKVCTSR